SEPLGSGPADLGSEPSAPGSAAPAAPLGSGAARLDSNPDGSSATSSAGAAGAEPGGREAPAEPGAAADLWSALREVNDPEFPISVVDLGLIYGIRRAGARVEVDLTFTATACPCMDFIREDVRDRLLKEPGV